MQNHAQTQISTLLQAYLSASKIKLIPSSKVKSTEEASSSSSSESSTESDIIAPPKMKIIKKSLDKGKSDTLSGS